MGLLYSDHFDLKINHCQYLHQYHYENILISILTIVSIIVSSYHYHILFFYYDCHDYHYYYILSCNNIVITCYILDIIITIIRPIVHHSAIGQ